MVENHTGFKYNFVFINYYPDGFTKISNHQDNESSLNAETPIACLSLGASRRMIFSRNNFKSHTLDLQNGSLMIMHTPSNIYWKHGIPIQPSVVDARISLTFRALSTVSASAERTATEEVPSKRRRFVPIQEEPDNKLLLEKDICIGKQLKVFHTRLGVYVVLYPVNTGHDFDYSIGVLMNPTTWMEFARKFQDFNFAYSDSAFMCSDKLLVCAKFKDTCSIQQLISTVSGYRCNPITLELNRDEVNELKHLLPHVSDFVLDTMFSYSLTKLILASSEKAKGIPPLATKNEEVFLEMCL